MLRLADSLDEALAAGDFGLAEDLHPAVMDLLGISASDACDRGTPQDALPVVGGNPRQASLIRLAASLAEAIGARDRELARIAHRTIMKILGKPQDAATNAAPERGNGTAG